MSFYCVHRYNIPVPTELVPALDRALVAYIATLEDAYYIPGIRVTEHSNELVMYEMEPDEVDGSAIFDKEYDHLIAESVQSDYMGDFMEEFMKYLRKNTDIRLTGWVTTNCDGGDFWIDFWIDGWYESWDETHTAEMMLSTLVELRDKYSKGGE